MVQYDNSGVDAMRVAIFKLTGTVEAGSSVMVSSINAGGVTSMINVDATRTLISDAGHAYVITDTGGTATASNLLTAALGTPFAVSGTIVQSWKPTGPCCLFTDCSTDPPSISSAVLATSSNYAGRSDFSALNQQCQEFNSAPLVAGASTYVFSSTADITQLTATGAFSWPSLGVSPGCYGVAANETWVANSVGGFVLQLMRVEAAA